VPDWQKAAGSTAAFDVASVRRDLSDKPIPANFSMDIGDSFAPTGGIYTADVTLGTYVAFAYKIWLNNDQIESLRAHGPKSITEDRFEIRARASGNPTKDQVRLMMQSLLADRFKLAVHYETHETSVLALTLVKPGKLGPKFRSHADGPPCDPAITLPPSGAWRDAVAFPPTCGNFTAVPEPDHVILFGSRDATLSAIADSFSAVGRFNRPVVDQTGLSGKFDFTIEWTPDPSPNPGADAQPEAAGTSFLEAMREQLGLKLTLTKTNLRTFVIDHVEMPSEN